MHNITWVSSLDGYAHTIVTTEIGQERIFFPVHLKYTEDRDWKRLC